MSIRPCVELQMENSVSRRPLRSSRICRVPDLGSQISWNPTPPRRALWNSPNRLPVGHTGAQASVESQISDPGSRIPDLVESRMSRNPILSWNPTLPHRAHLSSPTRFASLLRILLGSSRKSFALVANSSSSDPCLQQRCLAPSRSGALQTRELEAVVWQFPFFV